MVLRGAARGRRAGVGAELVLSAFFLKIGSSGVVKLYQKRTFREIAARKRRFFFGYAEHKPNALGGRNSLGSRRLRLFGF